MLKHMTGKRVVLLFLLLMSVLIAIPVYTLSMQKITYRQFVKQGGTISYLPAYLQLPKFAGNQRIRLPDLFCTEISNIEIGAWSNGFTHLKHLGDYSRVTRVTLLNPEHVSPEVHQFWKDKPWIKYLELIGEGDFRRCLQELEDSMFNRVYLFDHHLTESEAVALAKMKSLNLIQLEKISADSSAVTTLKEDGKRLLYFVSPTQKARDAEIDDALSFLNDYGPVEILNWNVPPWASPEDARGDSRLPKTGDNLALEFLCYRGYSDSKSMMEAFWKEFDTNHLSELNLSMLSCSSAYHDTNHWPIDAMEKIKSVHIATDDVESINSSHIDLDFLANLPNLESLISDSKRKLVRLQTMRQFPNLKTLIIVRSSHLQEIAQHVQALPKLEVLEVPPDCITIVELQQLLNKPGLQNFTFSSGVNSSQHISPEETKALCGKHGWTYKSVQDSSFFRYTLVRDKSERNNE